MEFTIYSIGDSEFLEQVLISLAMITGTDDFGAMIQVGLLVGVISTIMSAIAKGGREIEIQHVLLGYIIWSTMFIPTSRVLIEDTYTGNIAVVDNVPMGAAAAGGIISLVGFKITELFEVSYGPIIPRVTQTEFGESLRILNDIRGEATNSGIWRGLNKDAGAGFIDLRKSWISYIKDCTLKKIDLQLMSADDFATTQYQEALQFNATLFGTRIYTEAGNPDGKDVDCAEGWIELNGLTNVGDQTTKAFDSILGFDSNNLPVGEDSMTKTQTALAALLGAGVTSQNYMKIAILDPIVKQAASGKYDLNQDMSGALMINQAIQQRNTQWAAEQSLFMTIVRPMLAFFEAFIYAVTPIMAFVIVLGSRGVQLAGKYFALLIWIQLWMPILSVINLYIYVSANRKMEVYALMDGHNWDSFYALNSAADVMQNWIATGGLLASSTPAIALMLIYGSSVTATHLAGRLKSTDSIDEKYDTPDIKNNKPLGDVDSMYSGDSVSGLMRNGTQGTLGTATVSSVFTSMAQSGKNVQNTESEQFSQALAHSVNSSQNANEFFSKANVAGAAASSGDSTISRNAMSQAHGFVENHGIDQEHMEGVAGVAALSASLGANLDVDKAAGYMSEKFGVARSAAKGFLEKAGLKGAPGTGLAVTKDGSNDSILDVNASATAQASAQSRTTDQTKSSSGQKTSSGAEYNYSGQEQSQFNQELSSQITRQDTKSSQNSWGSGDSQTIQNAATELVSATENYQTASGLQKTLGAASNIEMRTIGALAAGRDQAGISGNTDAQKTLNSGWAAQPEAVKSQAQDLYNRYASWGMPQDVATNTARLTALTDSNNFAGNPNGHVAATMLAAQVIQQATGVGGNNNDFNFNENSGLDKPSFQSGDIKEKTEDLIAPDISPTEGIQKETQKDVTSVYGEQDELPTSQLQSDHNSRKAETQSSGRSKEQQLVGENESKYRSQVQNAPEMGTAASMFGAYDNTSGWVGRKAEQIAGGTGALLDEIGGGVSEAVGAYKDLSPQDASTFRQAMASQDDALFDSMGAWGLPVKGAQMVGNQVIGAAVSGVDAYSEWSNNGSDLSQSAQGLSVQEKGAFFAAAAGEAAVQGGEAFSSFMSTYGDEFKNSMEQIGQEKYGLTQKQAAVFAESYDTNNESMQQKVQNFKEDYAIRDEQGEPVWNSSQNEWAMTSENREFTDAVVDRITAATGAGDRVGSYLEPISGYNTATQIVTPNSPN